jgi:hypothetical protein
VGVGDGDAEADVVASVGDAAGVAGGLALADGAPLAVGVALPDGGGLDDGDAPAVGVGFGETLGIGVVPSADAGDAKRLAHSATARKGARTYARRNSSRSRVNHKRQSADTCLPDDRACEFVKIRANPSSGLARAAASLRFF